MKIFPLLLSIVIHLMINVILSVAKDPAVYLIIQALSLPWKLASIITERGEVIQKFF